MKENYGPCCVCGRTGKSVRNFLMLDKRSPYGHGWGCVQCGLAAEGAVALVCDRCMKNGKHSETDMQFFCKPISDDDYMSDRAPIAELANQPEWKHDMSRHPGES